MTSHRSMAISNRAQSVALIIVLRGRTPNRVHSRGRVGKGGDASGSPISKCLIKREQRREKHLVSIELRDSRMTHGRNWALSVITNNNQSQSHRNHNEKLVPLCLLRSQLLISCDLRNIIITEWGRTTQSSNLSWAISITRDCLQPSYCQRDQKRLRSIWNQVRTCMETPWRRARLPRWASIMQRDQNSSILPPPVTTMRSRSRM